VRVILLSYHLPISLMLEECLESSNHASDYFLCDVSALVVAAELLLAMSALFEVTAE
jgi:hypothetical protein